MQNLVAEQRERTVAQSSSPTSKVLDFNEFYQEHSRSLMGLARILTNNENEAEDLLQDVFADAHRQWDRVEACDNPRAWVRKIMTNKSTSRIRRRVVEQKALTKVAARPLRPTNELVLESPEIRQALEALPVRQTQTIVLKYWEDRTVEEIAEILGCGTETVKTHLRRGRSAMAKSLHAFKNTSANFDNGDDISTNVAPLRSLSSPGSDRSEALPLAA